MTSRTILAGGIVLGGPEAHTLATHELLEERDGRYRHTERALSLAHAVATNLPVAHAG